MMGLLCVLQEVRTYDNPQISGIDLGLVQQCGLY